MSSRPRHLIETIGGRLSCVQDPGVVYRVGFAPDPWAWSGWEYARNDGRFGGRWDDAAGEFRTVYAATTLLGCLLEVLAPLRPDPAVADELAHIDDESDDTAYPTTPAGTVSRSWLEQRCASRANLSGTFCCATDSETVSTLRDDFLATAVVMGLPDFDTAALKLAQPRELTQRVASWLWAQTDAEGQPVLDGVHFLSRHGDEHELWAVFERDSDGPRSHRVSRPEPVALTDAPALAEAMRIHGLRFAT